MRCVNSRKEGNITPLMRTLIMPAQRIERLSIEVLLLGMAWSGQGYNNIALASVAKG